MGKNRTPGLCLRGGIWHIDKQVHGMRLRESTGTASYRDAQLILAKRVDEIRRAVVLGERPQKTFRQAVERYFESEEFKQLQPGTKVDYIGTLQGLDAYIGDLPLEKVTMEALQEYRNDRIAEGRMVMTKAGQKRSCDLSYRTINKGHERTRRILNLATEWRDEFNQPWLDRPPKLTLLDVKKTQKPARPISWAEQDLLFARLPKFVRDATLFLVNTGIRESNARRLRWEWEVSLQHANQSIFVIPKQYVKNKEPRIVILNEIAQKLIEAQRGIHPTHVFTQDGQPITERLSGSYWKRARAALGLNNVRVHDLKHTFGSRLRTAGVSFEDRQFLLGHKISSVTTHYSAAAIQKLIDAANKVVHRDNIDDLNMSIQKILAQAS